MSRWAKWLWFMVFAVTFLIIAAGALYLEQAASTGTSNPLRGPIGTTPKRTRLVT